MKYVKGKARLEVPALRKCFSSEVIDIPKNMTAAGYAKLHSFLTQTVTEDPRLQNGNPEMYRQSQSAKLNTAGFRKPEAGPVSVTAAKKRTRKAPKARADAAQPPKQIAAAPADDLAGEDITDLPDAGEVEVVNSAEDKALSRELVDSAAAAVAPVASTATGVIAVVHPAAASSLVPAEPHVRSRFDIPIPEPVSVERRVQNNGHQLVVDKALPYLRQVMLDDVFCSKPPRTQVREALDRVDRVGQRFWGANEAYSRRRTVEDLILQYYADALRASL